MASAKFEFFDDENEEIMQLLLRAEELLDLKRVKPPHKEPTSGKIHLYFETKDHKKRTGRMKS